MKLQPYKKLQGNLYISFFSHPTLNPLRLVVSSQNSQRGSTEDPPLNYSPIVGNLIYGYGAGNENGNGHLNRGPAATHVAYLVVPVHRTVKRLEGSRSNLCCNLEKEILIYAPDTSLERWVVGRIKNVIPYMLRRFEK